MYNKTDWEDKQLISEALMDKIEDAIYCNTESLLNKFDDVTVEQSGATNTLTFYANGKAVKSITLTSVTAEAGTLETSFESYSVIGEKDTVIIPYNFNTENRGKATLYVSVVVGETSKELEYEVNKIGAGSVNLGTLTKGINYLSMYVIDAVGKMTNVIDLTIVCGALDITSTFDDGKDYEVFSSITIPFNVSALNKTDTMTLNVNIDGTAFTQQVYDGFNSYTYPAELRTIGVHSVTMQVVSTGFQSNILEYNIVVADSNSILLSSKQTTWETEEGYKVEVPFRISMIGQTMFTVKYYVNNVLYSTVEGSSGTNTFIGDYKDFTLGSYGLRIEVSTVDNNYTSTLNLTINIIENSFKRINHVTIGLQAYFNMASKTNGDVDKDVLYSEVTTDDGKRAKLVLHDYNYATNGWINGRLVSNGKAWAEIVDYLPLEDNAINGFTFDILFKSNNVGDNEARVVDCVGTDTPYQGFYIDSEKALIRTDSNTLTSYYTDKTDMRVTFVINRTSTYYEEYIKDENGWSIPNPNPTYKPNPMVQTYIDGIFTDVAMLSDTGSGNDKIYESIYNNQTILINTDKLKQLFGNNEIKSIRIYNRPLNHEEVLQNTMADIDDLMEQKKLYDKNYVTINSDLPTLNFYDTPIGKCEQMTKDTKQWINVVYTSPNTEKFGESFDLMGQTSWQGTSSLAYPTKNYKFKLYDWARDENGDIIEDTKWDKNTYTKKKINMYPSSGNGFKENTFCLKADYMDSSHCRNTGTARLVNDLLFAGYLNPAQQLDPRCRATINGFPCNLYINGRWMGIFNFNHDKSCTKSLGVEQVPNTVRWEIKANSDSSAGAFIKTWNNIEECYQAINTDFEIVYDEDAFEDKTGEYDVTRYYDELGFAHEGTVIGTFYDYAILSMARLVNFVSKADEATWKEHISEYINVEQACRYYLNVMTLGMIDNFAKNCIVQMYGDDIWWFHFYDMDSSLGLDNTGYKKFDSNIEPSQPNVYNCSTSRMWTKLNEYSKDDLFNTFKTLREGGYTYENLCKYLIEDQIDKIPQILYNKDMYQKYISQGRQYLHMLHGNNKDHLKRWLYNRFQYVDSLFLQHNSPYTKQSITIRSCKPTWIPEDQRYTARFEIQTYCPQYVTVCWRKNTFETKRVDWGETVVFEREMVNSQDNELIVYCAGNLKHIGDCSGLNPTSVDIGNATRLIEFICENSNQLVKADLSKNVYLRKASFKNCSVLGTASGGSNIMDVSKCTNLKEIDLRGTQITSLLTNISGGNLETILYPTSIQNVVVSNQINLKILGLPCGDDVAINLANVQILDCNNIETLKYPYNEENPVIDFESIKYVQNLTLDNSLRLTTMDFKGFIKLKNLVLRNMLQMTSVGFDDMLSSTDEPTMESITLINMPLIETLSFNVTSNDNAIKFKDGAVIDVSGLTGVTNIESNYAIQGLEKLLIPTALQRLIFRKQYGEGNCSLNKIYSGSATAETDICINLQDVKIRQLMIENLAIRTIKNLYYAPINDTDKTNTLPYIVGVEGTMDVSDFIGLVENLFNGLDLVNIINVINSKSVVMPQTTLKGIFNNATTNSQVITMILNWFLNVSDVSGLFKDNTDLVEIDLSGWNASNIINMDSMFEGCTNLVSVKLPTVVADKCSMNNMFKGCSKLNCQLNVSNASSLNGTFSGCSSLTYIPTLPSEYNGTLDSTFYNCSSLVTAPTTPEGVITSMANCYNGCTSLTTTPNIPSSCTDISGMIKDCTSITEFTVVLDDIENYADVLSGCTAITNISFEGSTITSTDKIKGILSTVPSQYSLNVSNIVCNTTSVEGMFKDNTNVTSIIAANWNTDTVTNITDLYNGASNLITVDMSGWSNISDINVKDNVFTGCSSLQNLDVSGYTISNLTALSFMSTLDGLPITHVNMKGYKFEGLTSLYEAIDIGDTDTEAEHYRRNIFCQVYEHFIAEPHSDTMIATNYLPSNITSIDVSNWDLTGLTSLNNLFQTKANIYEYGYGISGSEYLTTIIGLNTWDTSGITIMSYTFRGCKALTSLDLSDWNTSNVTDFSYMFSGCTNLDFTNVGVQSWDISSGTNFYYMFAYCKLLKEDIVFPSCATDVGYCFYNSGVVNVHSNWNNTYDERVSSSSCYYGCGSIATIDGQPGSIREIPTAWGGLGFTKETTTIFTIDTTLTDNLTFKIGKYTYASAVDWGDGTVNTGTAYYTNFPHTYSEHGVYTIAIKGKFVHYYNDSADYIMPRLSVTRVEQVAKQYTNNYGSVNYVTDLSSYFEDYNNLEYIDVSNLAGNAITRTTTMFYGLQKLTTIVGLDKLDLSKCTSMNSMFYRCTTFTDWDSIVINGNPKVTNIADMFYQCNITDDQMITILSQLNLSSITSAKNFNCYGKNSLATIKIVKYLLNNVGTVTSFENLCKGMSITSLAGLEDVDTSSVTDMSYCFSGCNKLTDISAIQNWNVSNVTNMSNMFEYCSKLTTMDLSNWNVSSVVYMSFMFSNCGKLSSLNVTGWNTGSVTRMNYMFQSCGELDEIIGYENWDTSSVTWMNGMFYACYSGTLTFKPNLSHWDTSSVTTMNNMFYISDFTDIDMSGCDVNNITNFGTFDYDILVNFKAPQNISVSIKFQSNKLTHDSLMSIINNLAEVSTTQTLTLGSTNLNKLTADEKAIATNKGWTLK